jgi:hypothetical protein
MNISDKTAQPVTLKQLTDFIKENLHLTWFLGDGGCFKAVGQEKKGRPVFKYFYPSIDTRTMDIFHIKTDRYEVDFREEFDGTILDLLIFKYKKEFENEDK